ncbi:Wzz/FepE/Etk N-terminal domain-containing protein [Gemmobacter lanyuensis]
MKDYPLDTAEIDLKDIIAILKRQRRLIVLTVLIVLGLGFAYILTAKPIYDSTTLLLVDSRGPTFLKPVPASSSKVRC